MDRAINKYIIRYDYWLYIFTEETMAELVKFGIDKCWDFV